MGDADNQDVEEVCLVQAKGISNLSVDFASGWHLALCFTRLPKGSIWSKSNGSRTTKTVKRY